MPTPEAGPTPAAKPSFKDRLAALVQTYGTLAVGVYLALFLVSIGLFTLAIQAGLRERVTAWFGVSLEGAGGVGGTLVAAWAATKAIQVPRILATLALTPLVARFPFVARWLERSRRDAAG